MGIFSKFERRVEDGLEGAADKVFDAPLSPVQISKKAERAMRREKMVGAGKQYAPTLYTVLVNTDDDARLFGYYPTLAGEVETYLAARAAEDGLTMDGEPLVRFIADEGLKRGKIDIVAELVSAPIVAQLRREEMQRYGLVAAAQAAAAPQIPVAAQAPDVNAAPATQESELGEAYQQRLAQANASVSDLADPGAARDGFEAVNWRKQPLPYVPEEEIDRSIDYGEYTFNSQDFEDYEEHGAAAQLIRAQEEAPAQAWDDDDFEADADLSGLDVEAYNPYAHDSRDFFVQDAPPARSNAAAPNTVSFAGGGAKPSKSLVSARLVDKSTNRSFDLAAARLILGRSSSCDIVVDDISASRTHAELRQESPGVWILTDLGSTNGTKVNGEAVASCELELGDRIEIGTTELVFLQG